jgi:8-oxo-dGTP diphosphatase
MAARREAACAVLIDTRGRFLMQQRDDIPSILHPGKVGLFGGHREDGESYLECVVREIEEEIGYRVPPERFTFLTTYVEPNDGESFVATDIPTDALRVIEGSPLIVNRQDVVALEPKFSPGTRFVMNTLLNKHEAGELLS